VAEPAVWSVEIVVDPLWYAEQDVDQQLPAPGDPTRVAVLDPAGVLVGRPSASLASRPAIDLSSDIGISRRHCRFSARALAGGATSWSVEDLSSSNGTFVASAGTGLPTEPLPPGVPRELSDGDRVYVGAWTRLTLRRATRRSER
jgi:hypothetical protein